MDTRWRNRILLAAWALLLTCGIQGILNGFTVGSTYTKKDYFQTTDFQNQLSQFITYLSILELNFIPKEEAKKLIVVTPEEIEIYRYQDGDLLQQMSDIKSQYDSRIEEATAAGNKEVADFYSAERDREIEDMTNIFKSDEYVKAKIMTVKEREIDEHYRELERLRFEFSNYRGTFTYYLRNIETGEVFTNVTIGGTVVKREDTVFFQDYQALSTEEHRVYFNYGDTNSLTIKAGNFEGQIGILKSVPRSSEVMADYIDFKQKKTAFFIFTLISALAVIGSLYLHRKYPIASIAVFGNIQPYYDRIPLDVRWLVLICTSVFTMFLFSTANEAFIHPNAYAGLFGSLVMNTFFVMLILVQGRLLWGQFSSEAWSKALVYKVYQRLKAAFLIKSIAVQVLILLLLVFALGAGLTFVTMEPEGMIVYIPLSLLIGVPVLWYTIKGIGYLNQIVYTSSEVAAGGFERDVPVKGKSVLATLAGNINTMKYGVQTSQKERAKSERLKTELITNVSHDLRTPLTSIITYTELLKQGDLSEADRHTFIEIIDRKAQRLKVLIDDLFEATKMASGHIPLVKEKIDLVQLLQQALAEHNEIIKESALQFRVTMPGKPVFALVDGQKLWRVFDNLIGNCLKYSLENTRVYISVNTLPNSQAVIIFKNVTKYEQSENVEELFERFKRGDASRYTDGSGLGLAIAKSIIDLHEGQLEIEIDGDLFKVSVTLRIE